MSRAISNVIRRAPGRAWLRAGKPGWDRPDVPLNETYVQRRRITLQTNMEGIYISNFLPEHALSNTSIWMQQKEDAFQYKMYFVKMLAGVVGVSLLLKLATFNFNETVFDYRFQRLCEKWLRRKLDEKPRHKAMENHFLGLDINAEMGFTGYSDELWVYKLAADWIAKQQKDLHSINSQAKSHTLRLIQEAEERADNILSGKAEEHGHAHGHDHH